MIGVFSYHMNDLISELRSRRDDVQYFTDFENLDRFDAIVICGYQNGTPTRLNMRSLRQIEKYLHKHPIYCEGVRGISAITTFEPHVLNQMRLMINCEDRNFFLDPRGGVGLKSFLPTELECTIYAEFNGDHGHRYCHKKETSRENAAVYVLNETLLFSGIMLSMFRENKFAPSGAVSYLVDLVLNHIMGTTIKTNLNPYYHFNDTFNLSAVNHWFETNAMLINEGRGGVYEGFQSTLDSHGEPIRSDVVRSDCVGEVAFMYYLLGQNNQKMRLRYHNLFNYLKTECIDVNGFMSWSNQAYSSMYPDDVARTLLPIAYKNLWFEYDQNEIDVMVRCMMCLLDYETSNGLLPSRIERSDIPDTVKEKAVLSAHYNSYVHALGFVLYRLTENKTFLKFAQKGLQTMLKAYPNTVREQSETQEQARLLLPLIFNYSITRDEHDLAMLHRISNDLMEHQHQSGFILEWDTGYKAIMRHEDGTSECSLLNKNGDTVSDLLYTNNWLLTSYLLAYYYTKDEEFKERYDQLKKALSKAQIVSSNPCYNGVWMRGFDPEIWEYCGSPKDAGWGPYCIESGWTVAEITIGMILDQFLFGGRNEV